MNIGFLITAYKLLHVVEDNIQVIQQYSKLYNSHIVVVTTAEEDVGFSVLETKYKNVHVIRFTDAPKYEAKSFRQTPPLHGVSLAQRIFLSIEKGLKKHEKLNTDICIHVHSESYWVKEAEDILLQYCKEVHDEHLLFSGDLCEEDSHTPIATYTHFHPEGLIINIKKAKDLGFIELNRIWTDLNFNSHNFGSIEALIGQFALYCVTGQLILNKEPLNDLYFKSVKARQTRPYHGVFKDGFVNVEIKQR